MVRPTAVMTNPCICPSTHVIKKLHLLGVVSWCDLGTLFTVHTFINDVIYIIAFISLVSSAISAGMKVLVPSTINVSCNICLFFRRGTKRHCLWN